MRSCPECGATYRGAPEVCPIDGVRLVEVTDPNAGRVIGAWRLREVVAEGPLATVYFAERGDTPGALKLYKSSPHLERARREGGAQDRVSHPNVAALIDRGDTESGEVYLVSEHVVGRPLQHVIAEHPLGAPWQLAARIVAQAAAGLEAIHRQALVHRDIKPSNLMLSDDEEPPRVRVLDLGHALVLDLGRLTESGLVWGSAPYMSPEQAAGHALDLRSDLYSLGVVLYELLVGKRPFEAKAAVDVMQMHWTTAPEPPSARKPELPEPLGELCIWLLSKDPDARPSSARIVQAALEGVLSADQAGTTAGQSPGEDSTEMTNV